MTGQVFNFQLCERLHKDIDKKIGEKGAHTLRLKKLENRFLAIITTLCLNLVGIIFLLIMNLK